MKVDIFSFSYRKGYPTSASEHGGGFIFDCRLLDNPQRDESIREFNGKHPQIAAHIEKNQESMEFLSNVCALVDVAIRKYTQRGYTSLEVGFGCTGGKHRSVYMAEALAKHLEQKFLDIEVLVRHTQGY